MHAWGMFAKEAIEEGAPVCEYVGEEIRKEVRPQRHRLLSGMPRRRFRTGHVCTPVLAFRAMLFLQVQRDDLDFHVLSP